MVTNCVKRLKAYVALLCVSFALQSCSSMEEPGTGIPVKMNVTVECPDSVGLPGDALSSASPFHVVGYVREKKCSPFSRQFESDAYADASGGLVWIGGRREWPGEQMRFIAYWPADASVILDNEGNVTFSDCILIGETEVSSHLSPKVTLTFRVN